MSTHTIHRRSLDEILAHHPSSSRRIIAAMVIIAMALFFLVSSVASHAQSLPQRNLHAAARLSSRLKRPTADLTSAMERRTELLKRETTLSFVGGTGASIATMNIRLKDYPSWISFSVGMDGRGIASIDRSRVLAHFEKNTPPLLAAERSCDAVSVWTDDNDVLRAQTSCTAASGYAYDTMALADAVMTALEEGKEHAALHIERRDPVLRDASGVLSGNSELTLLATGRSNFKGSGYGRKANVKKALTERIHNVVIPAGATFSFNDALGDRITTGNGWHMALTIFEGVNLRPAPGGGICQASTTLFRAALRAGLPILEHKSHSLYVTYYEAHGVGLDATVFPGKQDFAFLNDTGGPVVIQASYDGDEAMVSLFGVDDGRKVVVTGPYFAATAPETLRPNGRAMRGGEIVWERETLYPDGSKQDHMVLAKYNAIPKSLVKKYEARLDITRLGRAPEKQDVAGR